MAQVWWSGVPSGDGRCFVYSPRFGCTYLFSEEIAKSAILPLVLGLCGSNRREFLHDPATSVGLVGAYEKPLEAIPGHLSESGPDADVGSFLPRLYGFVHEHRTVASIRRVVFLAKLRARLNGSGQRLGVSKIGRVVMAVERSLGISDCYPRALLTAYLCIFSGLDCKITIGILAPTSNMHAWCATSGVIPYEPVHHHWWYNPLVVFDVT